MFITNRGKIRSKTVTDLPKLFKEFSESINHFYNRELKNIYLGDAVHQSQGGERKRKKTSESSLKFEHKRFLKGCCKEKRFGIQNKALK